MTDILGLIAQSISRLPQVTAIGIAGPPTHAASVEGTDLDFFIYCSQVPATDQRQQAVRSLPGQEDSQAIQKFVDPHWGTGDLMEINGMPCWLMYFACDQALAELEDLLSGNQLDRVEDGYYPVGRLATWQNMQVIYDPQGYLHGIQEQLVVYPEALREKLVSYHLEKLLDVEDLERAVLRKDILFYHFALDLALDHLLQALFALNRVYFPSRKRSLQYLKGFAIKPEACEELLVQAVRLGADEPALEDSFRIWQKLVKSLLDLISNSGK